jgi:hypothetical protein
MVSHVHIASSPLACSLLRAVGKGEEVEEESTHTSSLLLTLYGIISNCISSAEKSVTHLLVFCLFVFETGFCYVAQATASTSTVLGLQVCTTMPSSIFNIKTIKTVAFRYFVHF